MDLSLLPCTHLRGVGKQTAAQLNRLGINCIQDLLFHLPARYQDRTRVQSLGSLVPGEYAVIEGEISTVSYPKAGKTRFLCQLNDASGKIHLRFFHLNASQRHALQTGVKLHCFAEVRRGMQGLEMVHPEYQIMTPDFIVKAAEHLTPIYPSTEGLGQFTWRKLTTQALQLLSNGGVLHEVLPDTILQAHHFSNLKDAILFVHRPPQDAPISMLLAGKHMSQQRLVFEELLAHRLSLLQLKKNFQVQQALPFTAPDSLLKKFLLSLPFQLTAAQQRVAAEIAQDLVKNQPMLRLVQGDVGSGKTVVAALAILKAIENGYQAALLAPTELLAEQHYRTFQAWFKPLNISVVLLTSQIKPALKRTILKSMAEGETNLIVGTHAIFQKGITFSQLALIIIDEQHRFGVQQRALLREKGIQGAICPHQLIMTATPIPRTLAMSVYADLDYSIIDELPPGRTPVTTTVISNVKRDEIILRIQQACAAGNQAYWVCTLIAESEVLQCQAAENTAKLLQVALPHLKIGLIHGRMKALEKEEIMLAFRQHEIDLLVATTVIEVGVDVPNASLMVIENAERLGLAQLHQLRGRVGRGQKVSHCVLLYQFPLSIPAKERLSIMRSTTDGFKIAERDLELRGPGEVMGTRQTGELTLRIANLIRDNELLPIVQQAATILETEYSESVTILIKRWLGNNDRFGHV